MQHKNLIEEFEIEMWQYLDGTLSNKRMKFWEEKINSIFELQKMLEEKEDILEGYSKLDSTDLSDFKFEKMIDVATSKTGLYEKVKSLFTTNENRVIPKLAFGSILIIASVVILMLSSKPNPINNITNSAFGWEDESIDNKFANISTKISFLENEDLRKYYFYSRTKDKWDREIISIDKELNNLFEETKSREL